MPVVVVAPNFRIDSSNIGAYYYLGVMFEIVGGCGQLMTQFHY